METTTEEKLDREAGTRLGYDDTVELLGSLFAWRPGPISRVLIKGLRRVVRPLEEGSYSGRALSGEPHRASWVISGPLTVFALERPGYLRRVLLASRLRQAGSVNIIQLPTGNGTGRRFSACPTANRRRSGARALAMLARAGFAFGALGRDGLEGMSDLELLLAAQMSSNLSIAVVPVAQVSNQLVPEAPSVEVTARFSRLRPLKGLGKLNAHARTSRTGRLKNTRALALKPWLEAGNGADPGAAALREELAGLLASERRACEGPPLEPARRVKRKVLSDPVLTAYMKEYALREGMNDAEVLERAVGYLDEIASDYRVAVARKFCRVIDFAFDRFFEGLDVDRRGIRMLSECDSRNRVVLVCSHKSYLDPLLIGYTLFRSGMVPPQQAAGLNLDFWPVGWLLRHCGAFYLRRTFSGETLYREVFSAYVRYLLAGNYMSVVYIEGTRSRDGKLARPKLGYLGILADSLRMGVCRDIILVPTYLGYDRVPEEGAHVREMEGGKKAGESVKGFARIFGAVKARLGRAYVRFGEPMSMSALLEVGGLEGAAESVTSGINAVTPVTSRSLAACALLAPGTEWVSAGEVRSNALMLHGLASGKGVPLAEDPDGIDRALENLVREGHIHPDFHDGLQGFHVRGRGRRFLEYNKNIVLHHFLEESVEALAARCRPGRGETERDRHRAAADFLESLFDLEFIFSRNGRGDGGLPVADGPSMDTLASLLEPLLEGYLAAVRVLRALQPGEPVGRDELIERCFSEAERMLEEGSITRIESASRVAFGNALHGFARKGLAREVPIHTESGRRDVAFLPGERIDERVAVEAGILSLTHGETC